jgi:hypothetical protein
MARVTQGEIAALADGALPRRDADSNPYRPRRP